MLSNLNHEAMKVANPDRDVTMMVVEKGDADEMKDTPAMVIRPEPGTSLSLSTVMLQDEVICGTRSLE